MLYIAPVVATAGRLHLCLVAYLYNRLQQTALAYVVATIASVDQTALASVEQVAADCISVCSCNIASIRYYGRLLYLQLQLKNISFKAENIHKSNIVIVRLYTICLYLEHGTIEYLSER